MTRAEIKQEALSLPEPDRLELAEALWASLNEPGSSPGAQPLPDWQKQLLDERLQSSADEEGETWESVRAEVWPASG